MGFTQTYWQPQDCSITGTHIGSWLEGVKTSFNTAQMDQPDSTKLFEPAKYIYSINVFT